MNVEFHQLDLRYEKLRTHKPEAERKLVGSLAEIGQQVPVVVVHGEGPERFVLVDGYKRVRALRRLGQDLVGATCWDLSEAEALVLDRLMRTGEGATGARVAAARTLRPVRAVAGGPRPALRALGELGEPAAGAGGRAAGDDSRARAARRTAGARGHETPGPFGACQPGRV